MFLKKVMDRLFYTCEHNSYLIHRDQLEKLPVLPRLRMWMHLRYCKACRNFKKQTEKLEMILKKYTQSGAASSNSEKLDPKVKDKIREELREKLSR